ncbi:histidine phosphatase family protein [Pararobbsia silviterrae]|uniref:Histidine phosphatase family protein n=1 Tax=Pararobbsia silviterrae TaxID=1792498 RepID=A0A494Y8A4_9BURK|nr:histidine phosphatase family protein [Pararobbsia silviterrae]RKP58931.1 histidine phosphatase family protein [Pararobbsia silviterrae]
MTTTLILIRHGETSWNAIKRIQGFTDIPLNEVGLRQADDLGQRFAGLVAHVSDAESADTIDPVARDLAAADAGLTLAAKPIAAVYTSDLLRARQTAAPLAAALGLTPVLTASVRERNYGLFEGMNLEEVAARYPDDYAQWQTRDPDYRPGPGESQRMFYDRIVAALHAIAADHRDQRVVVVAHGGVLDNARRYAESLPLGQKRDYLLLNASINLFAFESDCARLIRWGDVAHLHDDDAAQDDTRTHPLPDTRVL